MKWLKSPPELIEAFDAVVPGPPVERRLMFGYPAAFVNGNMFFGLFQDSMVLKLDERSREKVLQLKGARPFAPMPGRPMGQFVQLSAVIYEDEEALIPWIEASLNFVSKLPPKKKKPKKKAVAKKAPPKKRASKK